MTKSNPGIEYLAVKDEDSHHPIASAWRPALCEIVKAFVREDYGLKKEIPSVKQIKAGKANHIGEYIAEYGETLIELPDATWETSIAQWMDPNWDVLVDLWTEESGGSDWVLSEEVFEDKKSDNRIRIEV